MKVLVHPKAVIRRLRNTMTGEEGLVTSSNEFDKDAAREDYFAIEAVNLSSFAVTIDNVGFEVSSQKKRMMMIQPVIMDDGKWPRRLDRRESVTVYGSLPILLKEPGTILIRNAFVETSCGKICRGSSGTLTGLIEYAANHQLGNAK